MALIGNIGTFNAQVELWSTYIERFEMFVACNSIPDSKKVCTLLTLIGATTYNLLQDLCTPVKPSEKAYEELVRLLGQHLHPKPSIIAERYKFSQRNQREDESIAEYVAQLKKLSTHCGFGQNLEDNLRDRLVSGLRSNNIKQRLLTEGTLTLDSAIQVASTMEAAARDASSLTVAQQHVAVVQHMRTQAGGRQRETPYHAPKGNGRPEVQVSRPLNQHQLQGQRRSLPLTFCDCCGKQGHTKAVCRFKSYACACCGLKGHLIRVCRNRRGKQTSKRNAHHYVNVQETGETLDMYNLQAINGQLDPLKVKVNVEGIPVTMQLDTGSPVSVISEDFYRKNFQNISIENNHTIGLQSYTGQPINALGTITVNVKYNVSAVQLPLVVVKRGGPPLLGRDWMFKLNIKVEWPTVNHLDSQVVESVDNLISEYSEVFKEELGTYSNGTIQLHVKENPKPIFFKPRTIPFALKDKVEQELKRLQEKNIITAVTTSEWATPIVPVLKPNGQIRICGDYKITINSQLEIDRYPLPRIEELFLILQRGQKFTKLDLSQAYQQVLLDEESKKYVTINTHLGLFQYNRMPYGVASAPGIFQRIMEQLVQGIPGVAVFLDDILITGANDKEHMDRLKQVLDRLKNNGLTVSKQKCSFMANSVEYLGFMIDKEGLHTSQGKIEAIVKAPIPKNVTQLKAFLGLVNYYAKFVPHLATELAPLYRLLQNNVRWNFDNSCKLAFENIKQRLISSEVLAHYNPELPIRLACDASAYGVGCVLSQIQEDGVERPIAYASRSLRKAEKNYSQIDKEALSLVYGVTKFNQYLWGRHFTLITDHKPLVSIFGPKKGLPAMAASRLQRYALLLSGYDFDISYVSSKNNGNADALSRLPLANEGNSTMTTDYSHINHIMELQLPITIHDIKRKLKADSVLTKVYQYVKFGWPDDNADPRIIPYHRRRHELTLEQDILMWGHRVVVPTSLRETLLKDLHVGHLGVVKMKAMARSYIWWPSIDADIEKLSKDCPACISVRQAPPSSSIHIWEYPQNPWYRVHLDFLGPFCGKLLLIVTDAYSKWLEVLEVPSTAATHTIKELRQLFARYGLPSHLVTDNGPPFTSHEFKIFVTQNGIRHTFTPPYFPQTNGLAENAVKTVKNTLKRAVQENVQFDIAIARFLINYRNVEHSTTNESPAKLFFNRRLRTTFDLLRPDLRRTVLDKQEKQIASSTRKTTRQLFPQQRVHVRNYRGRERWVPAIIVKKYGPVTYRVRLESGELCKRHINQILSHKQVTSTETNGELQINANGSCSTPTHFNDEVTLTPSSSHPVEVSLNDCDDGNAEQLSVGNVAQVAQPDTTPQDNPQTNDEGGTRRYPLRNRKPINRFQCT